MRYEVVWGNNKWEVIDKQDNCKVVFSSPVRSTAYQHCADANAKHMAHGHIYLVTQ